jgi:hypothetical protein
MTREPDFRELVGEDLPSDEETRLRRVHELLVQAGPLPELPPGLAEPKTERARDPKPDGIGVFQLLPRRRVGAALALAAAVALIAFLGGYLAGYRHNGFTARYAVAMHATNGAASAEIKVGDRDKHGNVPMEVEIRGLPKLQSAGYYEMFLTHGKQRLTCGTFAAGGAKTVTVRLTAPYEFHRGDGWIVVAHPSGEAGPARTVLTT